MSKVMFDFGGRYASFEAGQGQQVTRWADGATDIGYSNAFTDFDFNGLGLTMGFLGRTPIGCNTCISLVWGVRGSILWGDAERSVQTSDSVMEVGSDVQSTNSASEENCDTAFIFESLAGVQWDHELRCLPMSAYFRLAFEYQVLESRFRRERGSRLLCRRLSVPRCLRRLDRPGGLEPGWSDGWLRFQLVDCLLRS